MIKKIFLLFLIAVCLVGCEKKPAVETPVKIGGVFELTGIVPSVGMSAKNAAEMAVKEVNEQGGLKIHGRNVPVQLVIEDSHANAAQSVAAVRKLIKEQHVVAIVGPNLSASAIPASLVAEQEKILLITPWSTAAETTIDPKTKEHKLYVFRISFSDPFAGRILANFARYTKNYKTAAVLYEAGQGSPANQANIFKYNFEKLGGRVVAFETYKPSTKNFSAQLSRIKSANPDVLFLPDYYTDVVLIAQQAKRLGIHAELLGSDNWNRPELTSLAHSALEGAYFISHYLPDARSNVTRTFVDKYQKLYNKTPDDVAALTYDAYQILFKAINAVDSVDHRAIRDSLVGLPVVEGVTGAIDYKERLSGEPSKSAVIVQIREGRFVWVGYANP